MGEQNFLLVRFGGGEGDSRKSAAVQEAKLSAVQQRGFSFKGLRTSVLKSCLRIFPPMSAHAMAMLRFLCSYVFSAPHSCPV